MTDHVVTAATTLATGTDDFAARARAAVFAAIDVHADRLAWDRDRIAAFQRDRLRTLLAVAAERSPFHARRLAGIDPARFELGDLPRLPVMAKAETMAAFDDVVTDPRARRAAVEAAIAATTDAPAPIAGELIVLASGGSSGRRGLFAFPVDAFAEYACTLMRATMARMRALGGPPPGGIDLAIVGADSAVHATGVAAAVFREGPVRFRPVPVTLPVAEIVARLNDLQPLGLYGYPSMLARLAAEQAEGRLAIAPLSVTASSETLRADQRRRIRDTFGVPLVNTYGATEGLTGVSPPDDPVVTFASDACIVEPVDEHDRPVPPGVSRGTRSC